MGVVLIKALSFVAIVAMGYSLKRIGFFKQEDFYLFSRLVLRVTLPAAIIYNFTQITIDPTLLVLCVIGFLCNLLMVAIGYIINQKKSHGAKAFDMVNLSGYNVGNFVIPFVQSFLGPVGFAATSLFDVGNAVLCLGGTYSLVAALTGKNKNGSIKSFVKTLFSSVPFDAYLVMTIITLAGLRLPESLLFLVKTVGNANTFLAFLMVGIGFQVVLNKKNSLLIGKILGIRYGVGLLLAAVFYLFLPFDLEVRQAMALLVLGPIASAAPAFSGQLGEDVGLSSAINSLSIVISMVMITGALIILL